VVVLARLEREQPYQMQAVRMMGVRRQRLQAAKLSLHGPAFLHMPQPGLIERGRSEGGGCGLLDWPASIHGISSMQFGVSTSHI
jgi:hypothetical protein